MKKYIFEQLILNFFIFAPLVMGVSAGYQQQARERHAAGNEFRSGWWIKVCSWGVMFYTACFALWCWIAPDFNFFWDYIKYGVPPIAVYVVACKLVSLSYQNWVPVTVSKSSRSSAIHKYYDIFDTSNMWKVLTVTVDYGSPLVCLGNEHDIDPNNPDRIYTAEEKAWCIADDKARVTNEDRGLVVGAPGSGKTTYLVAQLIDWMESGKSFVATDIKPEIWGILKENGVFERFGYTDWVINPTDTASHHYNIFSEAMSSAELNEILAVVIPNTDESAEVFAENARRLLKAVIMELGKGASLPACQRYINRCDDVPELLKQLRQSDNEVVVSIAKDITRTAKNDNLLSSIMTSLSRAFAFLDDDRIRASTADSDVALKEVLLKPRQAVFLQFDQQYKSTTATLFGAMVAHTLRILQSNYRKRDEVFVALDEIINCAPIPKFIDTLNTMRSAKMPTFLYFQALEGLNRVYGAGADRLFMGACDFKAVYKISDIETAKVFSDLIGVTEGTITDRNYGTADNTNSVNERSMLGVSIADAYSKGQSNQEATLIKTSMMQVIEPDHFTKLQKYQAVCIYRGEATIFNMPVYHEHYPVPNRPQYPTVGEYEEHIGVVA
ncbi:MAG: type IV secretion system DNA-binding domain-containing protein [Acinetobacter sp.]|uniref:type IV secretory system conjugative DNA transfer family protein n=1 Tax=Acinetobacter sp. TaxID=472 RepID=UPI00290DB3AD|nr:type IV secretion system DNA-binding domain-containing protein [Acinetobacter sp.]MDU5773848.1 type IV secretion system DNA-binding domain-containing protein [Acinetobacter sp.]MDU5862559.1 type IV secretion system DNA-binding domain-containing protein [Acinetobacter sp.]